MDTKHVMSEASSHTDTALSADTSFVQADKDLSLQILEVLLGMDAHEQNNCEHLKRARAFKKHFDEVLFKGEMR